MILAKQLRTLFLEFFQKNDHHITKSSSLIPHNDQSLLFVNAGMVQFKNCFLGLEKPPHKNLVSIQKCLRAGGKHNDLDNVGHTKRHHTLFEMMGNFSFGGLSKEKAIQLAWKFITKILKIDHTKLYVTNYHNDLETREIWGKIIDHNRIISIANNDNFWSMGDTGPCGPCTEIFYDYGPHIQGGLPGTPEQDGDRFVEIWNLVFIQDEKKSDGIIVPLTTKCVDTGIGLERLLSVINNQCDNYETDDFQDLIKLSATLLHNNDLQNTAHRVIADHARATTFLIGDGILPGNDGRNYVLRRIIRRAMTYAYFLQKNLQSFLHQMVRKIAEQMQTAYPEIQQNKERIAQIIQTEEKSFLETLERGIVFLEEEIAKLNNSQTFSGATAFKLYDTFGFPLDLTEKILQMRNIQLEKKSFETEMQKQKERSKNQNFTYKSADILEKLHNIPATNFLGYENEQCEAQILKIFDKNLNEIDNAKEGDEVILIFEQTIFYAESGGQVGDHGWISDVNQKELLYINNTQKAQNVFLHYGEAQQDFSIAQNVILQINRDRRKLLRANHTTTHLLHKVLQMVLGPHITQQGSLVETNHLRFDFNHPEAISEEQKLEIEYLVNDVIRSNYQVLIEKMSYDDAIKNGFTALFSEKYGNEVRTVTIDHPKYRHLFLSKELCGGTHVEYTSEIGTFAITFEKSIAAGIRRIEAVTGAEALKFFFNERENLHEIAQQIKQPKGEIVPYIRDLKAKNKELEKQNRKIALEQIKNQIKYEKLTDKTQIATLHVENFAVKDLQELIQQKQQSGQKTIFIFSNKIEKKQHLLFAVTNDLINIINAKKIAEFAKETLDFQGGGRDILCQGSVKSMENLPKLHDNIKTLIVENIEYESGR